MWKAHSVPLNRSMINFIGVDMLFPAVFFALVVFCIVNNVEIHRSINPLLAVCDANDSAQDGTHKDVRNPSCASIPLLLILPL